MSKAPSKQGVAAHQGQKQLENDAHFWYALVNEAEAARFLGLSVRSMQGYRYKGHGPRFVRLSSRCVRYRRFDLREWSEARLRTSTSDWGGA